MSIRSASAMRRSRSSPNPKSESEARRPEFERKEKVSDNHKTSRSFLIEISLQPGAVGVNL